MEIYGENISLGGNFLGWNFHGRIFQGGIFGVEFIGVEFTGHPHNSHGQMLPDVWNVAEPLEVEYRQPIHQSSDQSNSGRREIVKPPCAEETEGQESRSRWDHQSS